MSEEPENINKLPEDDDWSMTAPDTIETVEIEVPPAQKDGWKMPDPVFRVSGGTVFRGSESEMPSSGSPSEQTNSPAAQLPSQNITEEKTATAAEIQPQPYISEEFNLNHIKTEPPVKSKSKASRTIFIILGILAMAAFAVAFLIGVYFLFFYKPEV